VSKFELSCTLPENAFPGNHQIYLKAFATTVGIPAGETQFDMHFDGQRYVAFYRIFEIGGGRMLGNYGGALDILVEKGLRENSKTQQAAGAAVGTFSPTKDNFLKSIKPHHSQSTTDVTANNGSGGYDIVRGRNRYQPAVGGSGVSANLTKSALIRSPSDPGLVEIGLANQGGSNISNHRNHNNHNHI